MKNSKDVLPGTGGPAWATRVAVRVEQDQAELRALADPAKNGSAAAALLTEAWAATQLDHGVRQWWTGSHQQLAEMCMHEGEAELAALLTDDELTAYARDVLYAARDRLRPDDPRIAPVDEALNGRTVHGLKGVHVSHLARAVFEAEDEQYAQSRGFRNRLIRLIGLSAAALAGLITAFSTNAISLDQVTTGSPSYVRVGLLIALFGAVGALIVGVPPLARVGGTWNPFSLPWYQMLLKIALGPVFAIVGVMMLQSGLVPNIGLPMSLSDLLVWALVFGAGQQAVTRVVDDRVNGMVQAAPLHEPRSDGSTVRNTGGARGRMVRGNGHN